MSDYDSRKALKASRRQILAGLLVSPLSLSVIPLSRAEPLTLAGSAAYVGLKLLDGGISYVGGRALAAALGHPTISDVRLWIRGAVEDLKGFMSEELRRRLTATAIEEIQSDLLGIMENLYHYATLSSENKRNYRFLLENSSVHTAARVQLSQSVLGVLR